MDLQPLIVKEKGEKEKMAMSEVEARKADEIVRETRMREQLKDEIQKRSKKSMADGCGIEVFVTALKVHCGGVVVVERACRALAQLSYLSLENSMDICKREGPQIICRAMQTHMANARVLEQACALLKNMFSSFSLVPPGMLLPLDCFRVAYR